MISIALDAFGGDNAPDVVVQGAINAVNSSEGKFAIVLCGPEAEVKAKLQEFGYEGKLIQVVETTDQTPELVEAYNKKYSVYTALYPALKDTYKKLVEAE